MRKVVIVNQAANYLTIGFANAFNSQFDEVALITGSVHTQGEILNESIKISWINRWHERPASKKSISYGLALIRMWWLLVTKYRRYEVFFVSVPPMGYLLNLIVPNRFSMVIWDVYPDVFKVAGMQESNWLYRAWSRLNRLSFRRAFRLFTISETMAASLEKYTDRGNIIVHPIWSIFQTNSRIPRSENPFIHENQLEHNFVVQYSGNIGATHNVESLIEVAKRFTEADNTKFQIIGRGLRQPAIQKKVCEAQLDNFQMLPFQSDAMFPYSLSAADLGVVILDERVGQGSVPSKAYNLMSFGIPALYIASAQSELAKYANKYGHAQCFSSSQIDEIAEFICKLSADKEFYKDMRSNALGAAKCFRRTNADLFVESYLNDQAYGA